MFLRRLLVSQFKNLEDAQLEFSQKINVLYGDNGEGKTNLLDSVYYLSACKSFFSPLDRQAVRYGQPQATLFGQYRMASGQEESIACLLTSTGTKVFKRNGKTYDRLSQHVGLLPVVMVAPQDTALVYGTGEERRKYLNYLLSQTEGQYLQTVQEYGKLLLQRNRLLKQESCDVPFMASLEEGMHRRATQIHRCRSLVCEMLRPLVASYYALLSGNKEPVDLHYESDLNKMSMQELFDTNRRRDGILQYTSTGVQRDDVVFYLDDHPLKVCGSQGQQKTFLIALKLAQFDLIKQVKSLSPILLLDDVFDKLDGQRVAFLLQLVAKEDFGQIFLTDSNKVRIEEVIRSVGGAHRYFSVKGGVFTTYG